MLTGTEICRQINEGKIVIYPFNKEYVNPNSVDITLSPNLLMYCFNECTNGFEYVLLDPKKPNPTFAVDIPEQGYILQPGNLYIGSTAEYTETHPPYIPRIDGKSSLARLGIQIHDTAGFGDIGFKGTFTLEISCKYRTRVYPYMRIGQISYVRAEGPCDNIYHGKYQNSQGVIASRSYLDFKEKDASFSPGPRPE